MKWKSFVTDYLTFSRKERVGIVTLVLAILIVFFFPKIVRNSRANVPAADTSWMAATKQLELKKSPIQNINAQQYDDPPGYQPPKSTHASLFEFDPNTLDNTGWKKLGIKDRTIATIQNYLSKGGHFHKTSDLKKIYGFTSGDYQRLEPYIRIESTVANNNHPFQSFQKKESRRKDPTYSIIDINRADTTAFIALPGIGSKLAARIINFREHLGGFYSTDQIGETYGLSDSTFQKIRQYFDIGNTVVRKININTASIDELKSHPYIGYRIANPVVAYRNAHGPFLKLEDLRNVMAVTDEIYRKVAPYLSIE